MQNFKLFSRFKGPKYIPGFPRLSRGHENPDSDMCDTKSCQFSYNHACVKAKLPRSTRGSIYWSQTESPTSNYYIGGSTCMTSMYKVANYLKIWWQNTSKTYFTDIKKVNFTFHFKEKCFYTPKTSENYIKTENSRI